MTTTIPTRGQLERSLSQRLQALYRQQFGHQPSKVTCQIFNQTVAIVAEESITPTEQLLSQEGQAVLAKQVRSGLEQAIRPQVETLVKEILNVSVLDVLSNATLETGRSGLIVVLSDTPEVRNPEAIPKLGRSRRRRSRNANGGQQSSERNPT